MKRQLKHSLIVILMASAAVACQNKGNIFGIATLAVPNPPVHEQYGVFEGIDTVETALYNLAVDDMFCNLEEDGTFRTGKLWGGVWTRDVSYSVYLSLAHVEPGYVKTSLLRKVDRMNRIIQDTGTGGAWPCSIDREIWIVAAYELYLETGDMEWLKQIYDISARSIAADYVTAYNPEDGLFRGESSFIDWRKQSYPLWMDCKDICQSECLGTNAVFVGALKTLQQMATLLGETDAAADYEAKAAALSEAINKYFWMEDKGYYCQYRYGRNFRSQSPRSETLGEALCIIWGVASYEQARSIMANMPVSQYGPTIFWPQIAAQAPYHNNAIWPFVTAYYALAASEAGSSDGLLKAIEANATYAAQYGSNYENRVSETGSTETMRNSPRQLWSIAGYIGMYRRILLGMHYQPDGIMFTPDVPAALKGTRTLKGLRYRDMTLDITVKGYGCLVRKFVLDGEKYECPFVPCDLTGNHTVEITLTTCPCVKDVKVPVRPYTADIDVPQAVLQDSVLVWNSVAGADHYDVVFNGERIAAGVTDTTFVTGEIGEYSVIAVKADGVESFMSEPLQTPAPAVLKLVGKKLDNTLGTQVNFEIDVPSCGRYAVDFAYSNGNGEIETRNKCATRMLYIDDVCCGSVVMPQRGKNNWESVGWTNSIMLQFCEGPHVVELRYLEDNINMNIDVDEAMVHLIRLTRISGTCCGQACMPR